MTLSPRATAMRTYSRLTEADSSEEQDGDDRSFDSENDEDDHILEHVSDLREDLTQAMKNAAYLRGLSRVIESAEKLRSLPEDTKTSQVYKKDDDERKKLVEEHFRLHQILSDEHKEYKDMAKVVDFANVSEEHLKDLKEPDKQCKKEWTEKVNALDVKEFTKTLRSLQGQRSRESLIAFLESLTVDVDISGLQHHFHLETDNWGPRQVEAAGSTLVMDLPQEKENLKKFLKRNICFSGSDAKVCCACGSVQRCITESWKSFKERCGFSSSDESRLLREVSFDCGYSISPATRLLMRASDREVAVLLRELTDISIDHQVFTTVFACSLVSLAEMRVRHTFKLVILKDALFVVLLAYVGYHVRNDILPGTLAVLLMFGLTLVDFLRALLRVIFYIWARCEYNLKITRTSGYTFILIIVETFSIIFILFYVGSILHTEWTNHGNQFYSFAAFWQRRAEVWLGSKEKHGGGFFGAHPNLVALLVLCRWSMFIMNLQLIDVIGRNVVPLAHAVTRPESAVFLLFLFCSLLATFHAYFVFPLEHATDLNSMLEDFIGMFRLEMLSDFDLAELQHMRENITGKVEGSRFVGGVSVGGNRQFHEGIRIGFVVISLSISVVAMNTYIGLLGELYTNAVKKKNQIYNHYLATVMWPHLFMRPLLLRLCGRDCRRCGARNRKSCFDCEEAKQPEDAQFCWMFYDTCQTFDQKSD